MGINFRRVLRLRSLFLLIVLGVGASLAHAQLQGELTSFVNPNSTFLSAEVCGACHTDQYEQWRSSMMSYSSISPPIHALELTENHVQRTPTIASNAEGLFGFGRLARSDSESNGAPYTEPKLFCQKCHAPVAVFTDLFSLYDNLNYFEAFDVNGNILNDARDLFPDSHSLLKQIIVNDSNFDSSLYRNGSFSPTVDQVNNAKTAVEGVTCTVCHRMTGQDTSLNAANSFTEFFGPRPFLADEEGIANSSFRIAHINSDSILNTNYGPYDSSGNPVGIGNPSGAPHPITAPHGVGLSAIAGNISGKVAGQELVTGTDGIDRPYLSSSLMCGSCHDVRIPFADAETGENFRRVENLFTEWKNSPWNNNGHPYNPGSPTASPFANPGEKVENEENLKVATTCQDCHMSNYMTDPDALPKSYDLGPIANGASNLRRKTNHRFVGVDRFLMHDIPKQGEADPANRNTGDLLGFDIAQIDSTDMGSSRFGDLQASNLNFDAQGKADLREVLLQKAVAFKLESAKINEINNELNIKISLENIGAGHNIPAGLSQERQVWIELEVLDNEGKNVYTSGYLSPIEQVREGEISEDFNNPYVLFDPIGERRYKDSYCGRDEGKLEYECDLDEFRVELDPALRNIGEVTPGLDDNLRETNDGETYRYPENRGLVNYQNGFRRAGKKVLTQFIADTIDNDNALKPFQLRFERYDIPLGEHQGPFTINSRLRFRPLPHEFLAVLKNSSTQSRVTEDVIKLNKVIEMEQDSCVVNTKNNGLRIANVRSCDPVVQFSGSPAGRCVVFDDHQSPLPGTAASPGRSVQCHGNNYSRSLPINSASNSIVNPMIAPDLVNVKSVALGFNSGCALHQGGTVSCWGNGQYGTLADGNTSSHVVTYPKMVEGLNDVRQLAAGALFNCAISGSSVVSCWGNGDKGALGDGNPEIHFSATPSNFYAEQVQEIAPGSRHACYLGSDQTTGEGGRVYCWGEAISNGFDTNIAVPTQVQLDRQAVKIGSGDRFSCALLKTGEVDCWGRNTLAELGVGDSSIEYSLAPLKVDLDRRAIDISVGRFHACALLSDATLNCWGWGILGDGSNVSYHYSPDQVLTASNTVLQKVRSVDAGTNNTCAITELDEIWCWGANGSGQLGLGDTTNRNYATKVHYKSVGTKVPYRQDFESGLPGADEGWYYYASDDTYGRIQVVDGKMRMDVNENLHYALNEAILRLDMTDAQETKIHFFQSNHADELNVFPASVDGHHNSDAVAISNDGYVWYSLLPSAELAVSSAGKNYSIDLDQVVDVIRNERDSGFTPGANFQIKFQQYDNYIFPTDGRQWDNISISTLPIEQNFNNGLPGEREGWEFYSSNNFGRIEVVNSELRMDVNTNGNYSLNEAILTADLRERTGLYLEFYQAEFSDEQHVMPEQFTGHSSSDGIAISMDGNTWYRIVSEAELDVGTAGIYRAINLDSEITRIQQNFDSNFSYGENFKIKFQQYDNYTLGTDGRSWGSIAIKH